MLLVGLLLCFSVTFLLLLRFSTNLKYKALVSLIVKLILEEKSIWSHQPAHLCLTFVLPLSYLCLTVVFYYITRPSTIVCALQRFSIGMCFRLYLHPGLWWDHNRRGWNIPLSKPTRISDSVLLLSNIVIPGLLEMVLLMFLKVLIFVSSIVYAALLTKTNRIQRIFNSAQKSNKQVFRDLQSDSFDLNWEIGMISNAKSYQIINYFKW